MKWIAIALIIILAITAISVISGAAAEVKINGATIQSFQMDADIEIPSIDGDVDIVPAALQLSSAGQWVKARIELTEGYSAENILLETVRLNYDLNGSGSFEENESVPADMSCGLRVGDYNNNGIPDVEVAFSRSAVQDLLISLTDFDSVTLTVNGQVGSCNFQGTDAIKLVF